MPLPPNFKFSQHNLQDYVDCPRRFQLKYIDRVAWPAVQSEPVQEVEMQMELGSRFHKRIQQFYLGIEPAILEDQADLIELKIWLKGFLAQDQFKHFTHCYPEYTLIAKFENHRMLAKYDLIAENADQTITILDWKTSRKLPKRIWLEQRIQTRLYPFLVALARDQPLFGRAPAPSDISLSYWYAEFPDTLIHFAYDETQFEKDRGFFSSLLSEIVSGAGGDFPKTDEEHLCRFCVYRSLCERGAQAGNLEEMDSVEEDDLAALSLEGIEEIAF